MGKFFRLVFGAGVIAQASVWDISAPDRDEARVISHASPHSR